MMQKLLLSLAVFFSLLKMHAAELDDSYTTLNDSIEKYLLSQPDKSLIYAKQLLTKAIQEDNDNQIAKGLASVSRSYFLLKDYENAQLEAKNHLRHVKNLDDIELLIGSLLLNSEVEIMLTNIDLSHELLLDALQIADSLNSDLYRETILSKLSGFYDLSGQLEKAVEMRKQSLYILENRSIDSNYTAVTKFQTVVYSYAVLAASFLKIDQIDSAKSYNEKVKLLAEEKDTCKLIYYYNIKGDILLKEGQYEKAEAAYQKSLYYCPPDYPLFDLNMAFRFGKVAYGLRNYERTIEILDNGLENYTVSEAEEAYMDEYYKLLADSYKATGNFEKANYFFEKYINTQSKLNALKGDLTAAMKAKEIENFKLEIEQQKIEKTKADNKMYTIVLVSMLAITILLLIVLRFYKIKRRNEIRFENLLSELEEPVTSTNLQETSEFLLEEIGVSAETKKEIVAGLEKLEEELYFLRQDCTAYNVAKKLKTNTSYLSKIVNHHYQKNFNTYINDLRIKYAILRLKNDKSFRAFAIQSIAEEVGYKSADSFVKYFKAETGLNPSFYIKQLEASRF